MLGAAITRKRNKLTYSKRSVEQRITLPRKVIQYDGNIGS